MSILCIRLFGKLDVRYGKRVLTDLHVRKVQELFRRRAETPGDEAPVEPPAAVATTEATAGAVLASPVTAAAGSPLDTFLRPARHLCARVHSFCATGGFQPGGETRRSWQLSWSRGAWSAARRRDQRRTTGLPAGLPRAGADDGGR